MLRNSIPTDPLRANGRGLLVLIAGLVVVLVALLLPLPRPAAISTQPWKVELVCGAFLFGIGLWLWRRSGRAPIVVRNDRLIIAPIILFVVWSGLSAVWARFPDLTVHHTLGWTACLVLLVFFLTLLRSTIGLRFVTTTLTIAALIVALVCAIDNLTLVDFASVEGAIRQRYAKYAEMVITFLPVLWVMTLYLRGRRYWLALLTANLAWIAVMLSLSKGAFLAGIGSFVIMFAGTAFFSHRWSRKRVLVLAGIWLVLTVAFQVFFTFLLPAPSTTDYLTGDAGNAALSARIRVLTWRIAAEMIIQHPLLGVGADNFGVAVNDARSELPATGKLQPEIAEDLALERAHNEPLQVFAELGVVGLILFLLAFIVFGVLFVQKLGRDRRLSPMLWAAAAGIAAFMASSMASSFSFRSVQNGVAFMMVFALGIYELTKRRTSNQGRSTSRVLPIACVLLAVTMLGWFGAKGVSEYYVSRAEAASDLNAAEALYNNALALDPHNGNVRLTLATRYAAQARHQEAAASVREAIDRGLGVTLTYSLLARYHALAGNEFAAEGAFAEGLRIFPGSVFLRVDNAAFLEPIGKQLEADEQMRRAQAIDSRQASGWYSLIKDGGTATFYRAQTDPQVSPPAELKPENAVRQFLDKK